MWRPDDLRFVFVTGKGGVGKTTVCAALAVALASRGKRVLIAMCSAKERISSMFASAPVGPEIAPVGARVWAVNIDPQRAFEEYGRMILKVPALHRAVFRNKYVRSFLPAVPGLSDWAMLGKAWFHTLETDTRGGNRFDVVLLDAPATGHGLDMLRVPKTILGVVPPGALRRDAERAWAMFQDARRTAVVVITLAEELPTTETIQLVDAVDRELRLPLGALVVNAVIAPLFSIAERNRLAALALDDAAPRETVLAGRRPTNADETARAALRAAAHRAADEELQARSLERLGASVRLEQIRLPYLFEDAATPAAIRTLAASF